MVLINCATVQGFPKAKPSLKSTLWFSQNHLDASAETSAILTFEKVHQHICRLSIIVSKKIKCFTGIIYFTFKVIKIFKQLTQSQPRQQGFESNVGTCRISKSNCSTPMVPPKSQRQISKKLYCLCWNKSKKETDSFGLNDIIIIKWPLGMI